MTDDQISKALALAIGWKEEETAGCFFCFSKGYGWRRFDYRDPAVIWPIAERYNAFSFQTRADLDWNAVCGFDFLKTDTYADTASKAVALAVIAGAKK